MEVTEEEVVGRTAGWRTQRGAVCDGGSAMSRPQLARTPAEGASRLPWKAVTHTTVYIGEVVTEPGGRPPNLTGVSGCGLCERVTT